MPPPTPALPATLDATFAAVIFDWDGTAVPDRSSDASAVRLRIEALCAAGLQVIVVTGTHVENVDGQLMARPPTAGRLYLCCNRGSEVFEVTAAGPSLVYRRNATEMEDRALDRAAARTVAELRARGLDTQIVSDRLNRRKIDIIPVPAWADPKKADFERLAEAVEKRLAAVGIGGLSEVVSMARSIAGDSGVVDPRVTSDLKHVEIGLTDKSDSARYAAQHLKLRGITGQLVMIVGDEFGSVGGVPGSDSLMAIDDLARAAVVSVGIEPAGVPAGVLHLDGGPPRFLQVLDDQLARRQDRRVPQIDQDPAWVISLPTDQAQERIAESLGSLANGRAGVRGTREEDGPDAVSLFTVGGVYGADDRLLSGPLWTRIEEPRTRRRHDERRLLDMRTATLVRRAEDGKGLTSIRFVSAATPHAIALRVEGPPAQLEPGLALRPPAEPVTFERDDRPDVLRARTEAGGSEIAVALREHVGTAGDLRVVERLGAWAAGQTDNSNEDEADARLHDIEGRGFDLVLAEHRASWGQRWSGAGVTIEGDPESDLAARFALFQLLAATGDGEEASVGARGLTGEAYGGHVFWDADIFVLPAVAAVWPRGARAMLEYRIRRLPAARAIAAQRGLRGARFPWESAQDGTDVTPRKVRGKGGGPVPINTGAREEHIVADVAWAAVRYAEWTGDHEFLIGAGRDLLVDTARYWASRVRIGPDGRTHLYGVMGPDEYHQAVDDNAYTNVMARWNLRVGADLLELSAGVDEPAEWRALADGMVDGWDAARGVYEQFAGYFALDPLLMSDVAAPPAAVDVLLGPEQVARSQLIKQADVLMLHHLVPDQVVEGSLVQCLDFYEPRTAHGSSLSPAISASLLARAGEPERALKLFKLASRLDLDDLTGTTAEGLHLATLGGVWQALAYGFLGLEVHGDELSVDPHLPSSWTAVSLRFWLRSRSIEIRAQHDQVDISCEGPIRVRLAGGPPMEVSGPHTTLHLETKDHRREGRSTQ